MLIVGENLRSLIDQYQLVSDIRCFDNTSISLGLGRELITLDPGGKGEITYGNKIPENWIKHVQIPDDGFVIPPKSCVLGCSFETINIPVGYFGLLQTKGSLARLFTFIHCSDGQIDPGYKGKVTFEITNMADFGLRLLPRQIVAQLFIIKTSTKLVKPYNGRYQGAMGPTVSKPEE